MVVMPVVVATRGGGWSSCPDLMQMGGGIRAQKDKGASLKNGVWKGVGKTSHQDTHQRVAVVCLSVSVYSGRGGVASRHGDEVLPFLLNKNWPI